MNPAPPFLKGSPMNQDQEFRGAVDPDGSRKMRGAAWKISTPDVDSGHEGRQRVKSAYVEDVVDHHQQAQPSGPMVIDPEVVEKITQLVELQEKREALEKALAQTEAQQASQQQTEPSAGLQNDVWNAPGFTPQTNAEQGESKGQSSSQEQSNSEEQSHDNGYSY